MDEYVEVEHRPLDLVAMATLDYDITRYQPVLFCAESLDQVEGVVGGFFDTVTDDAVAEMLAGAAATA